ncbi:hypothetical protein L6164_035452 [Bauhinia variegata]|uniref:Uncharacterized protein n=1 Tax=Bauhinia variegata TaxID=167791 RepID=A0ACB9KE03_BAUVA|nr:hypothetical protein L6164_035452 [Bauhinia variegata]
MIKSCASVYDARVVLNLLRGLNKNGEGEFTFWLSLTSYNRLLMCLSRLDRTTRYNHWTVEITSYLANHYKNQGENETKNCITLQDIQWVKLKGHGARNIKSISVVFIGITLSTYDSFLKTRCSCKQGILN